MTKIDMVNKWFTLAQSIVVIVGLGLTVWQLHLSQEATSADYVLSVEKRITNDQFKAINRAIDDGTSTTTVIKAGDGGAGGIFSADDVSDYISQFDDVGLLVHDNVITNDMAFNDFSTDVEKAWCNNDIRLNLVLKSQAGDHSATAYSSAYFGYFELLAKHFLATDHESCAWVDTQ